MRRRGPDCVPARACRRPPRRDGRRASVHRDIEGFLRNSYVAELFSGVKVEDVLRERLKSNHRQPSENTLFPSDAGFWGLDIQYISSAQACMASIYSISAPRRLAWLRYTVNQLRAGLHGPDIQ